jgi:serine/threonine protein kinase
VKYLITAVREINEVGIIHGDIKLKNILLSDLDITSKNFRLVVTDFG